MRKVVLFLAGLLGFCGTAAISPCAAQIKISGLMRVTPTTGMADTSLFVCSDSLKVGLRACKLSDIQKRLAFKAWDSLVVTNAIRTAGRTTLGDSLISVAVRPTADNTSTLGTSAFRWSDIRANTATFSGSITASSITASGITATFGDISNNAAAAYVWSGRSKMFSDGDGQLRATNNGQTGPAYLKAGFAEAAVDTTITTTVSYTINYTTKSFQGITLSGNTTQTLAAPTAPSGASASILTHVFVRIKNTSGGAITNAVVWNAVFHFGSGGTPANPTNGQHYIIEFLTDGTTYWEMARTTAIAN